MHEPDFSRHAIGGSGTHPPESPSRKVWREAVSQASEKAKLRLPQCTGRIEAAVKLVLAGDVELLDNSTARVAGQGDGKTTYHVVNGDCTCKDFPYAACSPLRPAHGEAILPGAGTRCCHRRRKPHQAQ